KRPSLGAERQRDRVVRPTRVRKNKRRLGAQGALFLSRKPLGKTAMQEITQEVVQLKILRLALGARHEELTLVELREQLARFGRAGDRIRQGDVDLRQQVEGQKHVLLGSQERIEEEPAKHAEERSVPLEDIVVGAALGQQHKSDGPASRRTNIDLGDP